MFQFPGRSQTAGAVLISARNTPAVFPAACGGTCVLLSFRYTPHRPQERVTPLIWEGMVIRADDEVADELVRLHYGALEAGNTPPEFGPDDSSTGVCQIFGRTGIRAINFGRNVGLISARQYDPSRWQDVWEVWQRLSTDEEFCIRVAAINMILEAGRPGGVTSTQLRSMTPSQVMAMCVGYNDSFYDSGQGESGMIYGRNRMQLYYAIQRWHESFR